MQIEYDCFQVRLGLVGSTVWIGSEYGFFILLDESASESHTENSTRTAPYKKGVFWKRGLFRKKHFLEVLENLQILEILENLQSVENKGESDHLLESLENLEILEILENLPVKRPFRNDPFFRSRYNNAFWLVQVRDCREQGNRALVIVL